MFLVLPRPQRLWGASMSVPIGRRRCAYGRSSAVGARGFIEDAFVLDFDGVLCDSQGEVMSAGLACARGRWPQAFDGQDDWMGLVAALNRVRPRLVSGYESMLMARYLVERGSDAERDILGCDDWSVRVRELEDAYACTRGELSSEFEMWRMRRIEDDFEEWLGMNPLYDGVRDAMDDCQSPIYFASSKSGRRLIPLLRSLLDVDVEEASPRVFHSLIPPNQSKLEALETVLARPIAADVRTQLHFVDDRFETLEYILENAGDNLLDRFRLYLASWGYCTPEEIERAQAHPRVRVLNLEDFCELLRFGIIMNVDDGCQDTEQEARDGVYKPHDSR